jgi:hypothetical protein
VKKDYPRPKKNDSWETDDWIQQMFPLHPSLIFCNKNPDYWFDPCPLNDNWERNGLTIPWVNRTFVNPPYSNPLPWVEKAIKERDLGNTIVMLLKHDSSTKWYRLLHEAGAHMMMIQGRLKYGSGKGCAFPSVLVTLTRTKSDS